MTQPNEHDSDDGLITEPEFNETDDVPAFANEHYSTVESLLRRVDADGVRLSALLMAARRPIDTNADQTNTDHLLALHVLGLFGAPRLDLEHGTTLAALADDSELDDDVFAGNDLLVVRGRELAPLPEDSAQEAQ